MAAHRPVTHVLGRNRALVPSSRCVQVRAMVRRVPVGLLALMLVRITCRRELLLSNSQSGSSRPPRFMGPTSTDSGASWLRPRLLVMHLDIGLC
jgi:hypothetical protein